MLSGTETIALVLLGTAGLVIQLLRHPRPDPRLASEPVSLTVGKAAAFFAYMGLLFVIGQVLPRGLALPVGLAVMVAAIGGQIWWARRHPAPPRPSSLWSRARGRRGRRHHDLEARGLVAVGAVCALVVAGVVLLTLSRGADPSARRQAGSGRRNRARRCGRDQGTRRCALACAP
ncbi:MAG: hypothetical protein U0838_01615 [Chloroflexota bacterium]